MCPRVVPGRTHAKVLVRSREDASDPDHAEVPDRVQELDVPQPDITMMRMAPMMSTDAASTMPSAIAGLSLRRCMGPSRLRGGDDSCTGSDVPRTGGTGSPNVLTHDGLVNI